MARKRQLHWQEELAIIDRVMRDISSISDPDKLVAAYWTEASTVVIYAVMAAILLVRPQGLFGIR